jgi:hypothetical protein
VFFFKIIKYYFNIFLNNKYFKKQYVIKKKLKVYESATSQEMWAVLEQA